MTRQRQLALEFRTWGGKRNRAGRRPNGAVAGVSHLKRPSLSRHHPSHVTLRIVTGLPSLRTGSLFARVQKALAHAQQRFGFRLVHYSVQSNHLHLITEAEGQKALARGMQGLCVRVARAVNRQLSRKGRVFADRYHARALRTPRAAQLALRYVLLNARKHHGATSRALPPGFVDACSSAPWFDGFRRPIALAFGAREARARWRATSPLEAPVALPHTWLLRFGVQRCRAFDVDDVPRGGG